MDVFFGLQTYDFKTGRFESSAYSGFGEIYLKAVTCKVIIINQIVIFLTRFV